MKKMNNFLAFVLITYFLHGCGISEKEKSELENKMIQIADSVYMSHQIPNPTNSTSKPVQENKEIPTDANKLLKQIKNKQVVVLFHGIGTEPFWDLYITQKEVLHSINEENTSYVLLTPFDKNKKNQIIKYKNLEGKLFEVTIIKEPGGDGMSSRTYPYSVIWSKTDPHLNGAGDSKLMSNWSEYEK